MQHARLSRPAALWLTCLLAALAWDASGLDLPVMRLIGDADGFPLRHHPWLSRWLHDGLRQAALALLAVLLLSTLWPGRRQPRRERWAVLLAALAAVCAVNLLKWHSLTSCPWELTAFGGDAHYVSHWRWGRADGGSGRCFPGGHAASAFAFIGLALPGLAGRQRRGWVWLGVVLFFGGVAGLTQTLRGAHYPSHTLWTLVVCLSAALPVWAVLTRRSPAQAQPQGQVNRHADHDGAEHAPLPDKPGRTGGSGEQAGVPPGVHQHPLRGHHLGHDHRRQGRDRRVLQATLGPVRQLPGPVREQEKRARDHGHHPESDNRQ